MYLDWLIIIILTLITLVSISVGTYFILRVLVYFIDEVLPRIAEVYGRLRYPDHFRDDN